MSDHEYTDRLNAFEVLYAVDTTRADQPDLEGLTPRASHMVKGVLSHVKAIDDSLNAAAIGWTVSRMPVVDRNILRLAAFELMYSDISAAIVINEAVELAKTYSTSGSGKFVNGVLDGLATTVRDPSWKNQSNDQGDPPASDAESTEPIR